MARQRSQPSQVRLDLLPVPVGEVVADVGPELGDDVLAAGRRTGLDVGVQVGLAQPLPGPVGERGHGVGGQPQQRADLGRAAALDLGVPEHELPALGQRGEGRGRHLPLDVVVGGRRGGQDPPEVLGHVVRDVQPLVLAGPVVEGVAHAGQQVGPEGHLRTRTALQRRQDAGEGLRDDVLGVGLGPREVAADGHGRVDVTAVELLVGADVAHAHRRDQLGVAALGGVYQPIRHRSPKGSGAPAGGRGPHRPA